VREHGTVVGAVVTFADVTERQRFEAQLAHQAFSDALTDLPNRARFMDELAQARAHAQHGQPATVVLFLDLDNFKLVNDSLGHQAGDRLLTVIAERLRRSVRPTDTVARLDGDEFTVLARDLTDADGALALAEQISRAVQQPLQLGGHEIVPSCSIGIAFSAAGDGATPEQLLQQADLAMYEAKGQGKARAVLFQHAMTAASLERLELEADLRGALERGEFTLVYQPIVAMATDALIEVEALVRWQHPQRGTVPPSAFIPLAEETGLIIPLGRWVLQEACRQAAAWAGGPAAGVVMSVNLSARQFQDPDLVADVASALAQRQLDPGRLRLEITETVVMRDVDEAVRTLSALKAMGVHLAIDDFGTGYSSLAYLKRFPVDTLKIDRSFVAGLAADGNDAAIVRSVTALARSLGLAVTGEGIETPAQQAQLRSLGCDRGQGFLYARPLTADACTALLCAQAPLAPDRAA
jgi:diguanylate cyclase (GGDEF)-like protein